MVLVEQNEPIQFCVRYAKIKFVNDYNAQSFKQKPKLRYSQLIYFYLLQFFSFFWGGDCNIGPFPSFYFFFFCFYNPNFSCLIMILSLQQDAI